MNINIDGYRQPFTLGSRTAKGGVATYVRDEYNVNECNDLNLVNNSFEAVWVEIKNTKAKNIVCGCIYKHPKSDNDDLINKEKKGMLCLQRFQY